MNTPLSNELSQENLPEHIAIIMDGNGRWAKKRTLPRIAGHRAGVKTLRQIVQLCATYKIRVLTVYAFSSENWKRPEQEVSLLMELFMNSLKQEVNELHKNRVRLRFIGDRSAFPDKLINRINQAESLTADNTGLQLLVAANYGGRWDITNAIGQLLEKIKNEQLNLDSINEQLVGSFISTSDLPEPDLFIRTGGECRISNFLLWQLAYTELYFTDCLWPDFNREAFEQALRWYQGRERRFGQTSEQLERENGA